MRKLLIAPAVSVLVLAVGCASASSGGGSVATVRSGSRSTSPAATRTVTATGTTRPATIVGTVFGNPYLTSAGGELYLRWDLRLAGSAVAPEGLARVDPGSGKILAENTAIAEPMNAPAYGDGFLWVTDSAASGEYLLRLNERSLAVTGRVQVSRGNPGYAGLFGGDSPVAFAGGLVWADGGGRLVAVDPATMTVRRTVTFMSNVFGSAIESDVTASSDGSVGSVGSTLVVSEADGGVGTIQRRDPRTGALLASVPTNGVIEPLLAGIVGGYLWVSVPTGMMGYVQRLSATTLRAVGAVGPGADTPTFGFVEGSNDIRADLWDGELWVTDQPGGARRNYCADPVTGRRRATIPLPRLDVDIPMTVAGSRVYYEVSAGDGFTIRWVRVPAACAQA